MATTHFSISAPTNVAVLALPANLARVSVLFINNGSVPVYLGPVGVTVATGVPILPFGSQVDDASTSAWYAVTAGGAGSLVLCEVY